MAKIDIPRNMHQMANSYLDDLWDDDVRNIMADYIHDAVWDEEVYWHAWEYLNEWDDAIEKIRKDYERDHGPSKDDVGYDTIEFQEYVDDCAYDVLEKYTSNGLYTFPYDVLSHIMNSDACEEVAEYFRNTDEVITMQEVIDYAIGKYDFSRATDIACKVVEEYLEDRYGN